MAGHLGSNNGSELCSHEAANVFVEYVHNVPQITVSTVAEVHHKFEVKPTMVVYLHACVISNIRRLNFPEL
jgi:hypothetical protein